VENQETLGSCTAQSIAGLIEALEPSPFEVSRLFLYYNERLLEGTVLWDSGAYLRDGIKAAAKWGTADEAKWPHIIQQFRSKPPCWVYKDAETRKIQEYRRLNSLEDMYDCLASGLPFVFGFTVYPSFESSEVARTGVARMPLPGERALGGHAVCAVGYTPTHFIVRNSWGAGWGQGGYFLMPKAYLADRNLSDDFWTITKLWV
jgi:C1A family cysteine protease